MSAAREFKARTLKRRANAQAADTQCRIKLRRFKEAA